MSQDLWVSWECPHCGLMQRATVNVAHQTGYLAPQIALCDVDEGGCDEYVVIKPHLGLTVTTYGLVSASYEPLPTRIEDHPPAHNDKMLNASPEVMYGGNGDEEPTS